jgi:hypothetical protein
MARPRTEGQSRTSYKALTYLHLPVIEKDYKPGDTVELEDLEAAEQDTDMIMSMVEHGTLGDEGDDIHPSHIIPDPAMPTIASVVASAQKLRDDLKSRGEEIPDELNAVADLDYNQIQTGDEGKSGDTNA